MNPLVFKEYNDSGIPLKDSCTVLLEDIDCKPLLTNSSVLTHSATPVQKLSMLL